MKPSLSTRSLEKIIDWCGKHPGHVYAEYFDNIAINLPESPRGMTFPEYANRGGLIAQGFTERQAKARGAVLRNATYAALDAMYDARDEIGRLIIELAKKQGVWNGLARLPSLPEPPQEQSGPKPFGYWRQ